MTAGNLLAYYNFDGQTDNQFGPAPATVLNGPAVIAPGTGFSGDANDGSLDLGPGANAAFAQTPAGSHFDSLTTNNAFSVSFWQFNIANSNSSAFWLHAPDSDGNMRGAQAHTPWGNGTVYFDQSGCCDPGERLSIAGVTNINVWQHFVFQRDAAGDREIWIDGALVASAGGADPVDPFDGIFTIGAEGPSIPPGNNSFNGRFDEFAVWNTTLEAAEIGILAGGAVTTTLIPEPSGILLGLLGLTLGFRRRR